MQLPASVQAIADVIGEEQALYLVGQLVPCKVTRTDKVGVHSYLSVMVPMRVNETHKLAQIIGLADARKLAAVFGGEYLYPANCAELYREYRNETIKRMRSEGMSPKAIAELMGVSDRLVRNLVREMPQVVGEVANDNTPANFPAKSASRK